MESYVSEYGHTVGYVNIEGGGTYLTLFNNRYYRQKALKKLDEVDGVLAFAVNGNHRLAQRARMAKWDGKAFRMTVGGMELEVVKLR